jgi:flagellar assembly protein FliH
LPDTVTIPTPRAFRPASLGSTPARDEAHDHARATGFAAGYAAGVRRAAQDAAEQAELVANQAAQAAAVASRRASDALESLARAAEAVRAIAAPVLSDATGAVHAAAIELAETVLGVELAADDRSARAALARVHGAELGPGPVTVRLHPRDVAALPAGAAAEHVRIVADATLAPGDAIAEHADGHLDARIGAALARARAALAEAGAES